MTVFEIQEGIPLHDLEANPEYVRGYTWATENKYRFDAGFVERTAKTRDAFTRGVRDAISGTKE